MRLFLYLLLLTAFQLSACAPHSPELPPTIPSHATFKTPTLTPTLTSKPENQNAASSSKTPSPSPTLMFATDTPDPSAAFPIREGRSYPTDRPLIAIEAGGTEKHTLLLADPTESALYEFGFPGTAHFATPFLAGLSPDARYFVTFQGGQIEAFYGIEHLRLSTPDLTLHVQDLRNEETLFSTPLLSPGFPQDLAPIAETIKDDWNFTFQQATFEDVVAATEEFLLDNIRNVAWSPDGSLLAYAAQDPGPSSDLHFFSTENGTARGVTADPGHILKSVWAPDSSVLITESSLYDRHAREDTTTLVSREGSQLGSFTSQIWFFANWHDSTTAFLYGGTDSGDYFELKTLSAPDGTVSMFWEGTWSSIAFTPDLSTFLVSSIMPSAPIPPHPGLFLGSREDGSLKSLSEDNYWEIAYWGSKSFPFAASSIEAGTAGVTTEGELVKIGEGYWKLAPSPDGRYLAGYNMIRTGYLPEIVPGLRIFDEEGRLLDSIDGANVTCVSWNKASSALAYQVGSSLYLWEAETGARRLVSDQLNEEACGFKWVEGINRRLP